jgi:hypothetical protein
VVASQLVHTFIGPANKDGGLLLYSLNNGYSKNNDLQDAAGIIRGDPRKSSFSDGEVNRLNKLVTGMFK